jgi:hypothetical protein
MNCSIYRAAFNASDESGPPAMHEYVAGVTAANIATGCENGIFWYTEWIVAREAILNGNADLARSGRGCPHRAVLLLEAVARP